MDVFSKEKRSKVMAAIRSKNTRPEIIVRKYLFAKGFRFRINHPRLPGHPDICEWLFLARARLSVWPSS